MNRSRAPHGNATILKNSRALSAPELGKVGAAYLAALLIALRDSSAHLKNLAEVRDFYAIVQGESETIYYSHAQTVEKYLEVKNKIERTYQIDDDTRRGFFQVISTFTH